MEGTSLPVPSSSGLEPSYHCLDKSAVYGQNLDSGIIDNTGVKALPCTWPTLVGILERFQGTLLSAEPEIAPEYDPRTKNQPTTK